MEVVIRKTIFGWIVVLQPDQKTMTIQDTKELAVQFCKDNNLTVTNR